MDHAGFDLSTLAQPDIYKLLSGTVMPRPIAWITTLDAAGVVNAAPFSFFNVLSSDPPLIGVGFSGAPDREGKDTLANIRANGELVVQLVDEALAPAMNVTASNAPRGESEVALAGLRTVPSVQVAPPRIADAPVAMECRAHQIVETGDPGAILLAHVLYLHVREDAFQNRARLYLDPRALHLIGRMHSPNGYCTTRDLFELERVTYESLRKPDVLR